MLIEIEYTDTRHTTMTESSYVEIHIEQGVTKYKKSNLVSRDYPKLEPLGEINQQITELPMQGNAGDMIRSRYVSDNSDVMRLISRLNCDTPQMIRMSMMYVYNQFMDWTKQSLFDRCDEFLYLVDVEILDIRLLISILMASNPIKNVLSYRNAYFSNVKKIVRERYGLIEAAKILQGLK